MNKKIPPIKELRKIILNYNYQKVFKKPHNI